MAERSSNFYVSHASFGNYMLTVHRSDPDSSEGGFGLMVFDKFGGELSRNLGSHQSATQAGAEEQAEIAREHAEISKRPIANDTRPAWKAGSYGAYPEE